MSCRLNAAGMWRIGIFIKLLAFKHKSESAWVLVFFVYDLLISISHFMSEKKFYVRCWWSYPRVEYFA